VLSPNQLGLQALMTFYQAKHKHKLLSLIHVQGWEILNPRQI
jgi:hypothetical protein